MDKLYNHDLQIFLNKFATYIDQQKSIHNNNAQHSIRVNKIEYINNGIFMVVILVTPSTLGEYIINYVTPDVANLWKISSDRFNVKNTAFYYNEDYMRITIMSQYQNGGSLYRP